MVTKSKIEYLWLLLPVAFAAWSISRVWTVLPSIMGDEYVYTSAAKHLPFAEQYFSNYVFSSIMSLTNMCGTDFYVCTKSINSVFFALTILLTFLIAIRFLTFGWSVFVASVTALSPIAIPVSYFMPEIMYFAAMTGVVLVALFVADKGRWQLWGLVGVALGIAALVKPHAIFMLPAFAVFAFLLAYKLGGKGMLEGFKSGILTMAGFVVAKFGLGFLFAGTEGLKLFGGYSSPIDAISQVASTQGASETSNESFAGTGLETFLAVTSSHFLMHLAIVLLLAGLPTLLSLRVMHSVARKPEPVGPVSSYFILIGLLTFSMIAVVAAFEAYVTVSGDDHSRRLILRYYEFLIPQFIVMGLLLPRFSESKLTWRIVQGLAIVLASLFFSIFYPANFDQQYADSSTLPGLAASPTLFVSVAVLLCGAVLYWIFTPNEGNVLIGRAIIPIFLIVALTTSQTNLIQINGTAAFFDQAGWDARSQLAEIQGERILVVGQTRTQVFTVKFWIDEPNIRDLLIYEGNSVLPTDVQDTDYVIILGNIGSDFPNETISEGEGYRLLKVLR